MEHLLPLLHRRCHVRASSFTDSQARGDVCRSGDVGGIQILLISEGIQQVHLIRAQSDVDPIRGDRVFYREADPAIEEQVHLRYEGYCR